MTESIIFNQIEKIKSKKDVNGKIDIIQETKIVLEKLKKLNSEYNCFSVISDNLAIECAENLQKLIDSDKKEDLDKLNNMKLAGVFVSIKDCICVKGVETCASSKILKGYIPVFDATVVQKLKNEGAIIVGKTIQDEFGFGSYSVNVGLGFERPKNPFDKERVTGGSSGGCAGITRLCIQEKIPHISIAESTGGSIENPASFCSVIGFCPTYGSVSRNGLLSYSNSLDKIGIMSEKISETALVFDIISGEDKNESTSVKDSKFTFDIKKLENKSKLKIGIIKESLNGLDGSIKCAIEGVIEKLELDGHIIDYEVSLPFTFEYGIPSYYIIAMSEASTNLSNLCGLRYGIQDVRSDEHFSNYFSRIRSENFGKEAKRRIMLGTFTRMAGYRDAFYIKAAKARTKVINEYKKLFETYDCLISPTMPMVAPKVKDIENLTPMENYLADIMTVGPNLAGIPHLSFPIGMSGNQRIGTQELNDSKNVDMPIGMMIMSDHNNEDKIFQLAKILEDLNTNNSKIKED